MQFIRTLRPLNLLLLFISQIIVFFSVNGHLKIHFNSAEAHIFFLLAICCTLVAANGYIINDIFDYDTDQINVKSSKLPKKHLWLLYILSLSASSILVVYGAIRYQAWSLTPIFVLGVFSLFLYSYWLQKQGTYGNVLVAIFSACAMGICLLIPIILPELRFSSERQMMSNTFIFIAFFLSWVREIIKDCEDEIGDRSTGYNTLIIRFGLGRTKAISLFIWFTACLCILCYLYLQFKMSLPLSLFSTILLLYPCFLVSRLIWSMETKQDFSRLSTLLKLLMFLGLLTLGASIFFT